MVLHSGLIDFFRNTFFPRPDRLAGRITAEEIITPTTEGMFFQPAFVFIPPAIPDPNIAVFQSSINEAKAFIKKTFFTNPFAGETAFQSRQRRNRIPRHIRFAVKPKGSVFGTDPFTGKLIPTGISFRGSQKTIDFFGGAARLAFNRERITRGVLFRQSIDQFIAQTQGKLGILIDSFQAEQTAIDNRQIAILESKFV